MESQAEIFRVLTSPRPSVADIESALGVLYHVMHYHRRHCARCYSPIIDDEGNPGSQSEACHVGREMIRLHQRVEGAYVVAVRA